MCPHNDGDRVPPKPIYPMPQKEKCRWLGSPTGATVGCKPCNEKTGGSIRLKVFECAAYGTCLTGTNSIGGLHFCDGGRCVKYIAKSTEMNILTKEQA